MHSQDIVFMLLGFGTLVAAIYHVGWKTRCRAKCGKLFSEKRLGRIEIKKPETEVKQVIRVEEVGGKIKVVEYQDANGNWSTTRAREDKHRNVKYRVTTTIKYPGFLCTCKRACGKAEWTLDLPPERTSEEERLGIES